MEGEKKGKEKGTVKEDEENRNGERRKEDRWDRQTEERGKRGGRETEREGRWRWQGRDIA